MTYDRNVGNLVFGSDFPPSCNFFHHKPLDSHDSAYIAVKLITSNILYIIFTVECEMHRCFRPPGFSEVDGLIQENTGKRNILIAIYHFVVWRFCPWILFYLRVAVFNQYFFIFVVIAYFSRLPQYVISPMYRPDFMIDKITLKHVFNF